MWQRFTERARKAVFYAQEEAGRLGQNSVGPEHLLLGMARVPDGAGVALLERFGVSLKAVRAEVASRAVRGSGRKGQDMQLTPHAKRVIDLAYDEARHLRNNYVGIEHLLLGTLRLGDGIAAQALADLGVTPDAAREQLRQMQGKGSVPEEALTPVGKMHDLAAYMKAAFSPETDKTSEELLSLDEAVKFLGTSKPTLYRLLGQDEIKGLKVGRQWRFRKPDLVAYMERSPVAVAAAPSGDLDTELADFMKMTVEAGRGTAIAGMQMRHLTGTAEEKTEALADLIVSYAIALHASDIHLEPIHLEGAASLLLRYRIDGVLQEVRRLPMTMHESLIARFKTKADMNLAEKRVPQDGRLSLRREDKDFDLRVSVVPSTIGESLAMGIILRSDVLLGLENLGLAADDLSRIRGLVHQPNGLFLATGPAGSGKTTLIYSCLQEIARMEVKTLTVEDPIELPMPFTTQVQVNKRAGVSFAGALRSFLRQDPDILFVGETRDPETAALAVEASLTGHLVLMILHAGDAPAALTRLLEMGLEPYLIAATVTGVVAQRLCRRICDDCKEAFQVPARELVRFGFAPDDPARTITLHRGTGCDRCRRKGFRGRVGLFELLVMTDEIAELIVGRAPQAEIAAAARAAGMSSLRQDGLRKVLDGVTTPDEVLRVCTAI